MKQFNEWRDFYALEPWGFEVDEARTGTMGSVISAGFGASVPPRAFMLRPPPEKDPEEQEHDEMISKLERAFGGAAKR